MKPWPRLSESLRHARNLQTCQSCGRMLTEELRRVWEECDAADQPEGIAVVLCKACSNQLIEAHPRLYHWVRNNAPFPGAMPLCADCSFQKNLACVHPKLHRNGGSGLEIQVGEISRAFVDGAHHRGLVALYLTPVVACEGRTL
jgi:hypothetical protein